MPARLFWSVVVLLTLPALTLPLVAAQPDAQQPPSINVTGFSTETTTYYDTIYLDGQVRGASPITALTVNGESLWRRESRELFFGYIAALQPGDNRFVLEAADKAGQTTRKEVVVHRKVGGDAQEPDTRARVMLVPLERKGGVAQLSDSVYDHLLRALVDQGRFQLVEREQLDTILQEQKLSRTALVDPQTAVEVGKLAAAEGIIVGTVTETPQALEVFIRFVDVETSATLAEEYVYGEEMSLRAVRTLAEGLALKIRRHFPRVQGQVVQVDGEKVIVDLGAAQLKKHMKLIVFREGAAIRHPITGKLLGAPMEVLGEVKVEAVSDDVARGVLLESTTSGEVKQLDKVITK